MTNAIRRLLQVLLLAPAVALTGEPAAPASEHTVALQRAAWHRLPFDDEQDFDESRRGFLAAPASPLITDATGRVVNDLRRFDFLSERENFDTIHPSLLRQARLNARHGLFEVVPGVIYQVRGLDIANMTLVRGDTGWIVFDVMLTAETARAAFDLADRILGRRPVVAVVYSHSHIDHFGGIRGVVDEADVIAGRVAILAPEGFMAHVAAENVYAGNAMSRRAQYPYGRALPASPVGYVDSGIGKAGATGSIGLIAPTDVIEGAFAERTIDGVRVVFQNTPGTEAPAEMNAYLPDLKTFWAAENITAGIHNLYTLRGALVRDPLAWSRHINEALYRFGQHAEVMIAAHNWPRWGNARVQQVMRDQRDAYANLNNQVLHLANQGVTINQIHNVYRVPGSLQASWAARQYQGSAAHNSRAVVNRYLGFWDANPATLAPLSPEEAAPLYVEMMGGAAAILERAGALYAEGRYRHAQEILNKLVLAQPGHRAASALLADTFEQLGYQQESASLRHSYLAAAMELRDGYRPREVMTTRGPGLIRALSTQQWWEAMAIRVDSGKAEGLHFTLNFVTPDVGQTFVIEMSNATLTCIEGFRSATADATLTIDRAKLERVMAGEATLLEMVRSADASLEGDASVLEQLSGTLVGFDPHFEIMPGTREQAARSQVDGP
jgi:alkyl sulfatase BDS1-like metallo-beta-lactamase superfamily hydrolase